MADQDLVLEVDCVTGIATTRSMTQEELDARAASVAQAQADQAARDSADALAAKVKSDAIQRFLSLGFTQLEAEAMFP